MNLKDRITREYLAGLMPKIVTGTYTGDGAESRFIDLGATPKAVYVCPCDGQTYSYSSGNQTNYCYYGGLALPDAPARTASWAQAKPTIEIVDGGFRVYFGSFKMYSTTTHYIRTNYEEWEYQYIAAL